MVAVELNFWTKKNERQKLNKRKLFKLVRIDELLKFSLTVELEARLSFPHPKMLKVK